jgi:STE24 endopeptidase
VSQGYVREHQYQMATQTFGPWLVDQIKGLGAGTIGLALAVSILYPVIRRTGERFWIWGAAATMAMAVFAVMIIPVVIDTMFNTYKHVADLEIKAAVRPDRHQDRPTLGRRNGRRQHDRDRRQEDLRNRGQAFTPQDRLVHHS